MLKFLGVGATLIQGGTSIPESRVYDSFICEDSIVHKFCSSTPDKNLVKRSYHVLLTSNSKDLVI